MTASPASQEMFEKFKAWADQWNRDLAEADGDTFIASLAELRRACQRIIERADKPVDPDSPEGAAPRILLLLDHAKAFKDQGNMSEAARCGADARALCQRAYDEAKLKAALRPYRGGKKGRKDAFGNLLVEIFAEGGDHISYADVLCALEARAKNGDDVVAKVDGQTVILKNGRSVSPRALEQRLTRLRNEVSAKRS